MLLLKIRNMLCEIIILVFTSKNIFQIHIPLNIFESKILIGGIPPKRVLYLFHVVEKFIIELSR